MASQIGAQMYTLREHLKTPADIAKTCARVREMGYEAIQVSAFGPIETEDLAKILKDTGLTCAATHVGLDMMKDVSKCLDYHEALGCKYTAIGGKFDKDMTPADWQSFAREFTQIADALAAKGLRVGYHNHSHEFAWYGGDRPAMAILAEHCGDSIWFELDTYWVAHGGGDPAAWIDRIAASGANRLPCVHFKDMSITPERQHVMCEVGAGNLNWPRILEACRAADVEWYLVERDSGEMDPFDSLKVSLDNMRAMGLH